jgi:hypothetical protein
MEQTPLPAALTSIVGSILVNEDGGCFGVEGDGHGWVAKVRLITEKQRVLINCRRYDENGECVERRMFQLTFTHVTTWTAGTPLTEAAFRAELVAAGYDPDEAD